jgi:hypothetical protein
LLRAAPSGFAASVIAVTRGLREFNQARPQFELCLNRAWRIIRALEILKVVSGKGFLADSRRKMLGC